MTKPDRLIAIGDIRGELDQLKRLLNTVAPTDNDRFVFLGDYIDRATPVAPLINNPRHDSPACLEPLT